MSIHRGFPAALAIICATFVPYDCFAQTSGSVSGRVVASAAATPLSGAWVRVTETGDTVVTADDGAFSLPTLPAGRYTLTFSYLGLESVSRELEIGAAAPEPLLVQLAPRTEVAEVVIVGQRAAQAAALNQQRTAVNSRNVVSADEYGRFPDKNAAEALQRVPGVAINREEKGGEGRYVSIRGLDSSLNSFTLNGVNVAQTDTDSRRVALDVFQVDALAKLVVHKSLLPDMDGDGIGGAVELETASAFDLGERLFSVTAEGNYNDFAGDPGGKATVTFADMFGGDDQFGVLVSATYNKRYTLGYNILQDEEYIPTIEGEEGEAPPPGSELVPWWFGLGDFDNERENVGASLALDWRVSDATTLALKGSYNRLDDVELSRGFFIIADDEELYTDGAYDPEGGTVWRARSEYEESVFTNSTLALSGITDRGSTVFEYGLGIADGKFDEPNDYEVGFEYELQSPVLYDYANPLFPQPQLSEADRAAILDPSNFVLGGNDIDADTTRDRKYTATFDVTWDPGWDRVRELKTGVKILRSEHSLFEANVLDAGGDLPLVGSGFEGGFLDTRDIGSPYGPILALNGDAVRNWRRIANALVEQGVLENDYEGEPADADSYDAEETIYAGYVMGAINLGRWEVVGGVRVEHVDFESDGYRLIEDDDGERVERRLGTSNDTQLLPRVQVNFRPTDRVVFRGAAYASLARPEFQFLNAATEIEVVDSNSIEAFVGNPDLAPAYAWNFEVGAERYFDSIGMISSSVFFKTIDDFIFAGSAPVGSVVSAELEASYPGFAIDAETVFNGKRAEIYGIELNYVSQFTGLRGWWSGFGVYANLTLQESSADTGLDGRGDVPFFNAPDYVGTAALTYQKYGIEANVAYTFRDDSLEELGPYLIDKFQQPYESLDVQLRYTLSDMISVYASAIDVLDDGLDPVVYKTLGRSPRYPEDLTFNGTTYSFGLTVRF